MVVDQKDCGGRVLLKVEFDGGIGGALWAQWEV